MLASWPYQIGQDSSHTTSTWPAMRLAVRQAEDSSSTGTGNSSGGGEEDGNNMQEEQSGSDGAGGSDSSEQTQNTGSSTSPSSSGRSIAFTLLPWDTLCPTRCMRILYKRNGQLPSHSAPNTTLLYYAIGILHFSIEQHRS